jgi:hypothetical protein
MSAMAANRTNFQCAAGRGVAQAVCAIVLFAALPSSAGATCGDWLAHPGQPTAASGVMTSANNSPADAQQRLAEKAARPAKGHSLRIEHPPRA